MKTKLNVFCVLILISVLVDLFTSTINVYSFFPRKVNTAFKADPKDIEAYGNTSTAFLKPDGSNPKSVTMINEVTGKPVRVFPCGEVEVSIDSRPSSAFIICWAILALCGLVLATVSLCKFVRFVWRVNKGQVFDWTTVKVLRQSGWTLIASSALFVVMMTGASYELAGRFAPEGYTINSLPVLGSLDLVSSFFILAMTEVLAIGIRLREDQELTI